MRNKKTGLTFFPIMAILLAFSISSCTESENATPAKGRVKFSVGATQSNANSRTSEKGGPMYLWVGIANEEQGYDDFIKLSLMAFGEGYVSEDVELSEGSHRLTYLFVMDEENNVLYATPREESPLSIFVNDPLDIEFDVRAEQNTLVTPQVLAVEEGTDPGQFGYANFGFDVVDVTALLLMEEDAESVVKVSYKFSNMYKTISGEVTPSSYLINLDQPALHNNIWNAQITVWTEPKNCNTSWSNSPYQKVYRLTTEMTFTGTALALPQLTSTRWKPFYYRTSKGIGYFFSADPLNGYNVEIHVPESIGANYCWMDRRFWKASGGETCNLGEDAYAHLNDMNGMAVGKIMMDDQPLCETGSLYRVDSFVAVNSDKGAFHEYFSWTIVNGVLVPSCDPSASARQSSPAAQAERPAPNFK